jgi:hypothetical protein
MSAVLWEKVLAFELDDLAGEYSFSVRLAHENFWTQQFTAQAIVEYKKFMFLAAFSDKMVSPSEIVDIVWHQHLVFTQSYTRFCDVLGKQIQHVPATHAKGDQDKFATARQYTKLVYEKYFGEQPASIWQANTIYDGLNLPKAKMKLGNVITLITVLAALVAMPLCLLLRPLYLQIDNPYFLIGYIVLYVVVIGALVVYNNYRINRVFANFDKDTFLQHMQPYELVYANTGKIEKVICGIANELITKNVIALNAADNTLSSTAEAYDGMPYEERQALAALKEIEPSTLRNFVNRARRKPIFVNIVGSIDALKKYFHKSQAFVNVFAINFTALASTFLLGAARVSSGMWQGKAVVFIVLVLLIFLACSLGLLYWLYKQAFSSKVTSFYKQRILREGIEQTSWPWRYYLYGASVLNVAFIPVVAIYDRQAYGGDAGASAGCGSSCGSGCGGGCGGCGS